MQARTRAVGLTVRIQGKLGSTFFGGGGPKHSPYKSPPGHMPHGVCAMSEPCGPGQLTGRNVWAASLAPQHFLFNVQSNALYEAAWYLGKAAV